MLVGIPLLILSAMFIASLKRKRPSEGVTVEDVPEIIVDAPPPIAHITSSIPPHLPAPGQPVSFATYFTYAHSSGGRSMGLDGGGGGGGGGFIVGV